MHEIVLLALTHVYLILVIVIKALIGVCDCTADLYMIIAGVDDAVPDLTLFNVNEMDEQEGINVVNVN